MYKFDIRRGGNLNLVTYKWVDLGYILSQPGQMLI